MNANDTIDVDFSAARALTPADGAVYCAAGTAFQIAAQFRTLRGEQQSPAAVAHLEGAAEAFDELGDDLFGVLATEAPEVAPGRQLAAAIDQAFRLVKAGHSPEVARTILQRALSSYRSWLLALSTSSDELADFDVASAELTIALVAAATLAPPGAPRSSEDDPSRHGVRTLIGAAHAPPFASSMHTARRGGSVNVTP